MTKLQERKISIDLDKVYAFPEEIEFIHYREQILVVAVQSANWIVLTEKQLSFFKLLQEGKSIREALGAELLDLPEAQDVLLQIEARSLDSMKGWTREIPMGLHFYLTNACNLRCPHCYMYSGAVLENELSDEEILKTLRSFRACGGKRVVFSGGEVSLKKNLLEILQEAHNLGLDIEVLSNGTLWSEGMIKAVAPLVYSIQFSIDGFNEEENAKIRGKGNFDRVLRVVERFIEEGARVEIAVTPFYDGLLHTKIDGYVEFAKSLIAKYEGKPFRIKFSGDLFPGRELEVTPELKKDHQRLVELIYTKIYGDVLDTPFVEFHREGGCEHNCAYGNITVAANGELYLCPAMTEGMKPFANLRTDSWEDIVARTEKAKHLSHIDSLEPCRTCPIRYICGADCRIVYFEKLEQADLDINVPARRKCSRENKDYYYDLMLRTNRRIFR